VLCEVENCNSGVDEIRNAGRGHRPAEGSLGGLNRVTETSKTETFAHREGSEAFPPRFRLMQRQLFRRGGDQKHETTRRQSRSSIAVVIRGSCTPLRIRALSIFVSACLAAGLLTACGGGSSDEVVANVGSATITKAEIKHWMSTLAGGDYYEVSRNHTVPAGLVSEPADYSTCVDNLRAAVGSVAPITTKPSPSLLLSKCRQLYTALKQQAATFLVEANWLTGVAEREGLSASDQDVKQLFAEIKKQEFTTERKLRQFLAGNRRSLADELFVVKLDVLRQKLQKKLVDGGKQAQRKVVEDGQVVTSNTTCRPGYVVAHCKQYKGERPTTHDLSAAVLIEQVAAITGSRPCVGRAACM
jgi:hypothetical protein